MVSDNVFIQKLKEGHQWQLWVAVLFLKEGFAVHVPELRIRPDRSSIDMFRDHGDIFVIIRGKSRNRWRRVKFEVKSRNRMFTSPKDYPYDTVYIDRVSAWSSKYADKAKPLGVIIVSEITSDPIVVPVSSQWKTEPGIYGWDEKFPTEYYTIPKEQAKSWQELVIALKKAE